MNEDGAENGLPKAGKSQLDQMCQTYRDVLRIKLGPDPPANVEPLVFIPKKKTRPYRSLQQSYSPIQRAFIENKVKELETVNYIYKNPSSRWASPALAVAKTGISQLRFTVDLRGQNS